MVFSWKSYSDNLQIFFPYKMYITSLYKCTSIFLQNLYFYYNGIEFWTFEPLFTEKIK